jgi:hypothetical protein
MLVVGGPIVRILMTPTLDVVYFVLNHIPIA